jgi:hypothetical protein
MNIKSLAIAQLAPVRLCSYCDADHTLAKALDDLGLSVTHGICQMHLDAQLADVAKPIKARLFDCDARLAELKATNAQCISFGKVYERWHKVGLPYPMACETCIMVDVSGESGMGMTLGIESDGYTHS